MNRPSLAAFDIDGVLADVSHRLHFLDVHRWERFFRAADADPLLEEGAERLRDALADHDVVYLTGRPERNRPLTERWLARHDLPTEPLYMRDDDDDLRPARYVKREVLRRLSRTRDIAFVLDDDPAVVRLLDREGWPVELATWLALVDAAGRAGTARPHVTRFRPANTLAGMSSAVLTAVAWPYANGPRHIGHVSGFGVPSDVFARFRRMSGDRVLMVSGTDEHGTPIQVQADAEGLTPRQLADKYNDVITRDLQGLGLSYDLFTRTTTSNHYEVTQQMLLSLHRNGYVVPKTQMAAISPSTGRTLPDRYVEGTCPNCGYDGARGDQCDNCGRQLDPEDLINPRSRINGETPAFVETEHLFLDLPAFSEALGGWLASRTDWRPNVLRFSANLVEDLKPRAITRDLEWGVPIPLEGWSDNAMKKIYVWFDAVIGYLSASVEWARRGPDPDAWKQWWTDPAAQAYYFMGKDNITFHSVMWPAILLGHNGAGDRGGEPGTYGTLNLPSEVVSSEYLTMSGSKFSTSRGTVIYVGDFLNEFGPDALRYFISVAGPESQDTDFTWDEFVRRTNFELANEWGNLVNRSIAMAHKNIGSIPKPVVPEAADAELLAVSRAGFDTVGGLLGRNRFKQAVSEALRVVSAANKYISEQEPWKRTDEPERRDTILHTALQVVQDANTLLTPFLPHAAQSVHEALGGTGVWAAQPERRTVDDLGDGPAYPVLTGDYAHEAARWEPTPLEVGRPLAKPTPIFAKLDPELGRTGPEWAPIR